MDVTEFRIRHLALKAYEAKAAQMRKDLEKNAPDLLEDEGDPTAALPDGTIIGTVVQRAGYTKAKVSDEAEFLDYVTEHHPDQIVMAVDPGFRKHLLALAVHDEIPGTEVTTVRGSYASSPTTDAYDMIWLHRETDPDFAAVVELP